MIANVYSKLCVQAEAHKLVISAFQHPEDIVSYDDESSLRTGTCSLSDDIYPFLDSQMVTTGDAAEGSNKRNSHKKGRFDYPQMSSALSPDVNVMPTIYSLDSFDEYGLNSMESDDLSFDQDKPLDLHCQVPDTTLICDSVFKGGYAVFWYIFAGGFAVCS